MVSNLIRDSDFSESACVLEFTLYYVDISAEMRKIEKLFDNYVNSPSAERIWKHLQITAAWLVQLGERQSAVWEIEGSIPRPDQHSGS